MKPVLGAHSQDALSSEGVGDTQGTALMGVREQVPGGRALGGNENLGSG